MTISGLLDTIFENRQPLWTVEFEQWVRESRRFRVFAETYADKIRKKLRNAQDDASLYDLYCELETAYRFLKDERITLEYEKLAQLKQRAPDFTAAYRVNTSFNVEVTRLRMPAELASMESEAVDQLVNRKLVDGICDKLGQMQPSTVNVLLFIHELAISSTHLQAAMTGLRQRAETRDDALFVSRGYQNGRDFLKAFQRLSVIFCRSRLNNENIVWLNSLARNPIPKDLLNALGRL